MGGSTTQQTQQSQQSQTAPWAPAQPGLQNILGQLGPALGNTGTSGAENSALQQLMQNAGTMPNFGGATGNLAGSLLNGNFNVNPNSTVGQSYDAMKAQYAPYTGSDYLNPYNNPSFQKYLDTTNQDITNSVNGQFAGAGRDLSGINQQALARGISQGDSQIFANQYNQNVGAQQNAIASLFGGGLGASQAALHQAGSGISAAGAMPQLQDQNAQSMLQAYAQQYGLPLSKLSGAESLMLPIAQLGSQSSGTGTANTTTTQPWYQQMAGVMGGVGQGLGGLGGMATGAGNLLPFFQGATPSFQNGMWNPMF